MWERDRIKQLEDLEEILIALVMLDRGSGFRKRLDMCIEEAEKLMKVDMGNKRFIQFLKDEAYQK